MLNLICSVCGSPERVDIETVTNVAPNRDEMFPVLLCVKHKGLLAKGQLDIRMNEKGNLTFILKRKK